MVDYFEPLIRANETIICYCFPIGIAYKSLGQPSSVFLLLCVSHPPSVIHLKVDFGLCCLLIVFVSYDRLEIK